MNIKQMTELFSECGLNASVEMEADENGIEVFIDRDETVFFEFGGCDPYSSQNRYWLQTYVVNHGDRETPPSEDEIEYCEFNDLLKLPMLILAARIKHGSIMLWEGDEPE